MQSLVNYRLFHCQEIYLLTYGMLKDIFSITEHSDRSERPLSLSNIPDCLNLLCGRDVDNLVKKPCSFISKVQGLSEIK